MTATVGVFILFRTGCFTVKSCRPSECDDVIRRAHVSRSRGLPHREGTDGLRRPPLEGGRRNSSVSSSRISVGRFPSFTGRASEEGLLDLECHHHRAMMSLSPNTPAHQHASTPACQHASTSARQHVSTSARQHLNALGTRAWCGIHLCKSPVYVLLILDQRV